MAKDWSTHPYDEVWNFWFPEKIDDKTPEAIAAFWDLRMQGGMDDAICKNFADVTQSAAEGRLDHWAETPKGRLSLILALDQFPRSLWRGNIGAFAQDIKATCLALEGVQNGHYAALDHIFQKQFYVICISHCEGPDHLARMDLCVKLNEDMQLAAPEHLKVAIDGGLKQAELVREIIAQFGRHPHRNPIYGRVSTLAEKAYIARGKFPHERSAEDIQR